VEQGLGKFLLHEVKKTNCITNATKQ